LSLPSWPLWNLSIDDDTFNQRRNMIRRSRSVDEAKLQRSAEGLNTNFGIVESNAPSIPMETGREGQEKRQPKKLMKKSKSLRAMNAAVSQFG